MTKRNALIKCLTMGMVAYERKYGPLAGIQSPDRRDSLIAQLADSVRRIEYVAKLRTLNISQSRDDADSHHFDPLLSAIRHVAVGNINEAYWLVFLFVHFGRHRTAGWRLARDVYAGTGAGKRWTWANVSKNPGAFVKWLAAARLRWAVDGVRRHFGNHRKYESLKTTGAVIESYVEWMESSGGPLGLIAANGGGPGATPGLLFDALYRSMDAVHRFGRTAKFDFLTMIGKLGLADISPSKAYLVGATGPLKGSRLLFANSPKANLKANDLEKRLVDLGAALGVGQQVLEDGLCNWQKSPSSYRPFRG
ncbi:MAG: hypothetical protein IPI49_23805 [Myxococcales bacterium]|nr:hypothetical protein [Myxococcales bacterium]